LDAGLKTTVGINRDQRAQVAAALITRVVLAITAGEQRYCSATLLQRSSAENQRLRLPRVTLYSYAPGQSGRLRHLRRPHHQTVICNSQLVKPYS
jgi:hypothetical protein